MKTTTIYYKKKYYPARYLDVVDRGGREHTLLIATESLNSVLDIYKDFNLDQTIYYFVEDRQIKLSDAKLIACIDDDEYKLCK